jgi:hypothetical protein
MDKRSQATKTSKFIKTAPHLPVKNLRVTKDNKRDKQAFTQKRKNEQ